MWDGLKTAVAGPYLGVATTGRGSLLLSWLQWRPRAFLITGGFWAVRVPARGPDDWGGDLPGPWPGHAASLPRGGQPGPEHRSVLSSVAFPEEAVTACRGGRAARAA